MDFDREIKDPAGLVPGYLGYNPPELRRITDQAIREYLLEELVAFRKSLWELRERIPAPGFDQPQITEQIDGLIRQLRFSSYGKARFFSAPPIATELEEYLTTFDLRMLGTIVELKELLVEVTGRSISQGFAELLADLVNALEENLQERARFIVRRWRENYREE